MVELGTVQVLKLDGYDLEVVLLVKTYALNEQKDFIKMILIIQKHEYQNVEMVRK